MLATIMIVALLMVDGLPVSLVNEY